MLSKNVVKKSISSWVLLRGIVASIPITAKPAQAAMETGQFRRIEQPLVLKAGVTLGGLGLIGLELWWFLLSKKQTQKVASHEGVQELAITVDGGYEPSRVVVKAGQPVRLSFLRRDPSSCLEKVVFPDFHLARDLVLNRVISVEFTPQKPGEYLFTCGMNMFQGVIEVQDSNVEENLRNN